MGMGRRSGVLVLCAAALAGCQTAPVGQMPPACRGFDGAATLPLPPTVAPEAPRAGKAGPLRYANRIPIGGGIGDIGGWQPAGRGWQSWRLRLFSENAKSLSVHLHPLVLPPAAQVWFCSPDGVMRHGPLARETLAGQDQFWSPQVLGPELWMEVLAPAGSVREVELKIAEAYAGYR